MFKSPQKPRKICQTRICPNTEIIKNPLYFNILSQNLHLFCAAKSAEKSILNQYLISKIAKKVLADEIWPELAKFLCLGTSFFACYQGGLFMNPPSLEGIVSEKLKKDKFVEVQSFGGLRKTKSW